MPYFIINIYYINFSEGLLDITNVKTIERNEIK